MKKMLSCFILFSTLIIANFAAASGCTISGNEMVCSYSFSASLFSNTGGSSGAGPGPMEDPRVIQSRVCSILPSMMKEKVTECENKIKDFKTPQTYVCNAMVETATKQIATGIEVGAGVKGTVVGTVTEVYSPRASCKENLAADVEHMAGVCTSLKDAFNTQLAKSGCTPSL